MNFNLTHRPRRIRNNSVLRSLVKEQELCHNDLVLPVFVSEQAQVPEKIDSMPEIFRWPLNLLVSKVKEWQDIGINTFAIFPQIEASKKNPSGSEFLNPDSLVYKTAHEIKAAVDNVALVADIALDPYTTHGHDGLLDCNGEVENDRTIEILAQGAVLAAGAGYDLVAPSDMMDGRVKLIREELDKQNKQNTGILSYSAKFSSAYYGPFRDAIGTGQKTAIDKSCYQLDPANLREAKRELELDFEEGADMLMVKPALCYLDVIHMLRENFPIPITAYNVSGECAMVYAASKSGYLNYDLAVYEILLSIRRAGADGILTYFAKDFAQMIRK